MEKRSSSRQFNVRLGSEKSMVSGNWSEWEQLMARESITQGMKWVEERKPEKKLLELGREPQEIITGQKGKNFPSCTCIISGAKAQFFSSPLSFLFIQHIVLNFSMEMFFLFAPNSLLPNS